jgi:Flp pilus assembly protein TadD
MNLNKRARCGLLVKSLITNFINKLKENEHIINFIRKFKENKSIADCINKLKDNKFITNYVEVLKKNKYFVPAVTIILCISVSVEITAMVKSTMTTTTMAKESIATNVAETDFYSGKYDAAIAEYTKMQEKDEWPIWNMKIAEIYSVEGDFVKSNEIIRKAYETRNKLVDTKKEKIDNLQEKDKELANYIIFTSLMNGEYKKSLEYGEMFLQDYTSDKALLKTMFTVYLVNGNKDKAKEIMTSYQNGDPSEDDLITLAKMNMLTDNMDECFSVLKDAWIKDKNDIRVFDVIEQSAAYNKADALDKILKLQKKDPNELAYKMWIAKIYSMSKDSAENADKLIDELKNKDVGDINLNLIKANMYDSLDDTTKLNEVLEEISKNDEKSISGYHAAAWLAYNNEDYDGALKSCEKSIIIDRGYSGNYTFLIPEIMEKQNKNEETEAYFRKALFNDSFNYEMILQIAEYYGNTLKNSTKALYYYDLASKMNPKDAEVYYNMALIKINNQRIDEAIDLFKESISINDKNPKYHRALGTVYINKEKNDEAIKEIRNAYSIDKNDIKTLNNAGCYYISIEGDITRGMTNLKAAYDGINENTSPEDKEAITENYNRVKNLSDAYNKKNGAALKVPDLKLFY